MNKWLILTLISVGLFLSNLYLAVSRGESAMLLITLFWLITAFKNYKRYKSGK